MKLDESKLLRLRLKKKWTQRQAAEAAGVSLPTYNRAENGKELHPLKADKIVKAFKADLDDLELREDGEGDAA